jgi:hypothetical protein
VPLHCRLALPAWQLYLLCDAVLVSHTAHHDDTTAAAAAAADDWCSSSSTHIGELRAINNLGVTIPFIDILHVSTELSSA